jgi:hypothetical protein
MSTNPYRTRADRTATSTPVRRLQCSELIVVGALFWPLSVLQSAYAMMHGQTGAFELTLPFLAVLLIPAAIGRSVWPPSLRRAQGSRRRLDRQHEGERAPLARRARRFEVAAVLEYDLAGDGEPEPVPVLTMPSGRGRDRSLEDPR